MPGRVWPHRAWGVFPARGALNIPEAAFGGVQMLTAMGIGMALNQARQNEIIDRLKR
jgi:hypothetical protein